jgi:hypothetical protein
MFALELNQRLHQQNSTVISLAAHPGLARTNLQPESVAATGAGKSLWPIDSWIPYFKAQQWVHSPSCMQQQRVALKVESTSDQVALHLCAESQPVSLWPEQPKTPNNASAFGR